MKLPFHRVRPDESEAERIVRREADQEFDEALYARADLDNAGLRLASQGRFSNPILGMFGQGRRRRDGRGRPSLREQGYDGD